ncbi:glycosyltransferase family 9 protein [Sphaerisporangium perillae]|uniref:glycosyltransferase family 9 protein n=1 Tax=Sphaerisporangium perillae TaxID=2935860 RepID=UPI00200C9D43|nr:glycosyltransferase family 9 protein [Sphaerisporangium perillae]
MSGAARAGTVLVARPDNAGDVLLAGPAMRAVAEGARRWCLLMGPLGRAAGELLPGVSRVVEWRTPWIDPEPAPMTGSHALRLLRVVREIAPEQALIWHLAAAVGTPVVSLFAPIVPAGRWAPYGVPTVVLGDQQAPCRGTRAKVCPIQGHPCLSSVNSEQVVEAVNRLAFVKEVVR